MTEINYWDSWKTAREKINNILDIAENSIPSIWENWHWFLWNTDTWINAQWPQWEQGIQGIQWQKWDKWDRWEQWIQGEQWLQWIQWEKWDKWPQWEKWDEWEKWNKWDKWDTGASIISGKFVWTDLVFTKDDNNTVSIENAKIILKWPQWQQWEKWEQGDKWEKWDTGAKWEQGEQWIQWEKWDKWEKWDQWIQGPQWEQGIQWEQWPQWPQWPAWPQWPTWPAWTYTAWQWIDITNNVIKTTFNYWTSDTPAATVQKEVSIPSITELNVWQIINVMPTITSTVANATLKLNNFEAYPMRYSDGAITTTSDAYTWRANTITTFLFDWTYWQIVSTWYDVNTTYTMNTATEAWKYTAGVGKYAISRYSLVMEKADWTWETLKETSTNYSTWTAKTVNTNWFRLWQIRYYNGSTIYANGALIAANVLFNRQASVDLRYSINCWTTTTFAEWDFMYIVGTIWADWLFYLDTTKWWSNELPSTADWKVYMRIGIVLASGWYTCSFLDNRPIFYHNWTKICEYNAEANEIIYKRPRTWNYTLQSLDWVLTWVAI